MISRWNVQLRSWSNSNFEGKTFDQWKKAAAKALGKKKEERTAQKAMDAGARLRRKKQRQEYAAKISGSEDNVPDEMRDWYIDIVAIE